ncbi:MAG: hypothetical protein ACR2M0_09610 [Chloroflexia bacterium]
MSQRAAARGAEGLRLLVALLFTAVALVISQQTPASVTQDLGSADEAVGVTGLNTLPEVSPEGGFRWGGSRVTFDLQPLGYPLDTRLHVSGARPADVPAVSGGAQAGGQSLGVKELPRTSTDIGYSLPAAAMFSINPRLTLTATTFEPPNDRRNLGVVFYRIETRSGPGLPAPWPAGVLLVSGLLAYAAARAVSRRPRLGLVVAVAWALLLGLLNATQRPWLVFYCQYFVVVPLVVLLLLPWFRGMVARRKLSAISSQQSAISRQGLVEGDTHSALRTPHSTIVITERPWPVALAVTGAALVIFAWHLVARAIPTTNDPTDNWTWGVAFYGALPWQLQALGVAIVAGALVWAVRGRWSVAGGQQSAISDQQSAEILRSAQNDSTNAPHSALRTPHSALRTPHSALVIAGLAVFSLLPVKYAEGDSVEFDKKITAGELWRERELLDFYLKAKLWRLWHDWWPLPSQLYAAIDTLAGGVYLAGAGLIGRAMGRTGHEAWVLVGGLIALGNILLFFGYVESYSLVAVASLFVLWACWEYTRGRVGFGTVGALATLAPLFHGSAIWWGPMVVAAWLLRARSLPQEGRWRTALSEGAEGVGVGLAIVLVTLSVMLIEGYDTQQFQYGLSSLGGRDNHTMMQLFITETTSEHYPFFSWANLGAVIQEQLLTAPLALVTILLTAATAGRGVKRLVGAVPSLVALGIGAASMFFYSITWNPDIGPRNDWDLLSQPAYATTLIAVYLLLHLPEGRPRRLALAAYLSVSGVHAAAWVGLHVLDIHV